MAKTQWHPAFCAAMRLELKENRSLQFTNEFNLTEKPLEVDMLVIKKPSGVSIDNGIGEFFDGHNLIEYKSPADHNFNQFSICRALAYIYYYCDRYQTWDVTLSLVVSQGRFNILNWLRSRGVKYTRRHGGIYTLHGISFLKVQIVITEEIDGELFQWLSALTDKLTEEKARNLVTTAYGLTENEDKRLAEAIVQVLTSANEEVFEKMKEDDTMASALMELMKPEVEKYAEESIKRERLNAIERMIKAKATKEQIISFGYTEEEIERAENALFANV